MSLWRDGMTTEDRDRHVKDGVERGLTARQIGAEVGVSRNVITGWAGRRGILLLPRGEAMRMAMAAPDVRERANSGKAATAAFNRVPKWVPRDLRDDYADAVLLYGEFAAARIVRAMKREAAAA